jgi:hypothetical protein
VHSYSHKCHLHFTFELNTSKNIIMLAVGCVTLFVLSIVNSVGKFKEKQILAGNCLLGGGCGAGQCCSGYGTCGVGVQYCGATGAVYPGWTGSPYVGSDCRIVGCGGGGCCSPYG